jgi:hypothetical protein
MCASRLRPIDIALQTQFSNSARVIMVYLLNRLGLGRIALTAFLCVASRTETALGQSGQMRSRVAALVFVTDSFPYPGNVAILRRRAASPQDVIVIRSQEASAFDLSEAVRTLLQLRGVSGDSASIDGTFRSRALNTTTTHSVLPWAERVLGDLRTQKPHNVAHVGFGRSVKIWLPASHPR